MTCIAIKADGTRCRNYAYQPWAPLADAECRLCWAHRRYTKAEHTQRWWFRYFRSGRIFTFRFGKHFGQQMIADLESGWVDLKPASVGRIPASNLYVDAFTLLVQKGYVQPEWNERLYCHCLAFWLQRFFYSEEHPAGRENLEAENRIFVKPYVATFLSTDEQLYRLLKALPLTLQHSTILRNYAEAFPHVLPQFLGTLTDCDAAKTLAWRAESVCADLAAVYTKMPEDNSLRNYMLQRFLPDLKELAVAEKATQKWRIDPLKEELVAAAWHPDRFQEWCLDEGDKEDIGYTWPRNA